MQRSTKSECVQGVVHVMEPVKNNNSDEAAKMFKNVAEAYDVLSTSVQGYLRFTWCKGLGRRELFVVTHTTEDLFEVFRHRQSFRTGDFW